MLPRALKAIEDVIKREGGFVNDPADAGGATNMGITLAVLREHRGVPVSWSDVRDMPYAEAVDIYHQRYIEEPRLNLLNADWLFEAVFDMCVHMGNKRAVLILQKAGCVFPQDGVLGPITAGVVNAINPKDLKTALLRERLLFYARLTRARPSNLKFLVGWTKRAFELAA
jgi:lysozyme family protein